MKGRLIVFTAGPRKIEGISLLAPPPRPCPPRSSFHLPVLVITTRRLQEFLRHMLAVIGLLSTSASHWAGRNSNFHTQMRRRSASAKLFLPRCTLRNVPCGDFEGRVIKCYQESRKGEGEGGGEAKNANLSFMALQVLRKVAAAGFRLCLSAMHIAHWWGSMWSQETQDQVSVLLPEPSEHLSGTAGASSQTSAVTCLSNLTYSHWEPE